ncbi:fumarylacetoacetate hydrolase family protein [soil metagenome]
MKLATYDDGSRDGQLIVVSRDLAQAHYASGIAGRLQQLLDDWGFIAPQLEELCTQLNNGRLRHAFNFEPQRCRAPLPRAFQWVSADANGLVRGAGDEFLGAMDAARFASEAMAIGCQPGVAAITGDVAQGVSAGPALDGVRLLMLVADWRLAAVSSGPIHSHAATAFGPVAVTPDELGTAWRGGRVELGLQAMRNGRKLTPAPAAAPPAAFGSLIVELARTRRLRAGSIIGALGGPLSAEPLNFGDSIRLDVKAADGQSVFGAIDQDITSSSTP